MDRVFLRVSFLRSLACIQEGDSPAAPFNWLGWVLSLLTSASFVGATHGPIRKDESAELSLLQVLRDIGRELRSIHASCLFLQALSFHRSHVAGEHRGLVAAVNDLD